MGNTKSTNNKMLLGIIGAAIGATVGTGLFMLARSNMQEKPNAKNKEHPVRKIKVVRKSRSTPNGVHKDDKEMSSL